MNIYAASQLVAFMLKNMLNLLGILFIYDLGGIGITVLVFLAGLFFSTLGNSAPEGGV